MSIAASQSTTIRLGTRGSLLARTQSQLVADALQAAHRGLGVNLKIVKTTGDQIIDRPLHEVGGKGLFTKELELALLAGEIDFAVHSFKDMPVTMPLVAQEDLIVAAVPIRADPRDVLISRAARTIDELPAGARVGTGSLRRRCQLLDRRADLQIEAVRGNIDTRLRKLREGDFDAVILAFAGLMRAGLFDQSMMFMIPEDVLLPAPGQARWRYNAAAMILAPATFSCRSMTKRPRFASAQNALWLMICVAIVSPPLPRLRRSTTAACGFAERSAPAMALPPFSAERQMERPTPRTS